MKGAELGHHGKECSFDAIVKKHGLTSGSSAVLLAGIVNGADTDNSLWNQPEAAGLEAIAEGFRGPGYKDDHEINDAEWIVQGKPETADLSRFRSTRFAESKPWADDTDYGIDRLTISR